MIKTLLKTTLLFLVFSVSCTPEQPKEGHVNEVTKDNTEYVNPFIGTGGHGHTFPGAAIPNGMVQLSPDTRTFGWDACGGYHHSDSSILGFSHTHLSGTGIGDLGDVLFMPFTGEAKINPGPPEDPDSGYRSRFSHENEQSIPGYYTVNLTDYDIKAELTASTRAGFHRYNFPDGENKGLIIDLIHTIHNREILVSEFKVISNTEIIGYKHIKGWAQNRHVYFHANFDQPFTCKLYEGDTEQKGASEWKGKKAVAVLSFEDSSSKPLMAKVGISSVDYEGAKNNLNSEIPHWDFDQVKGEAHKAWEKQLDKVAIEGGSQDQKFIFYTGLYHSAMSPYVFNDVDGR